MRTTGVVRGGLPRVRATGALMSVVVLAACGSPTGAATSPGTPSTTAHPTATGPLTPAQLGVTLLAGTKTVTSAHITMSSTFGGKKVLGTEGDETLAGGKITAMRLNERVNGIDLTLVVLDNTVYVKMPAKAVRNGKPWAKATGSKNAVLKNLAGAVDSIQESVSQSQFGALTGAAGSLRTVAVVELLDGVSVAHYSMLVDISKVHSAALTEHMKKVMTQAGITKIPVDIWVDTQGRTVKAAERYMVQGQLISVDMTMTRINQPVSIVAPPASLISADSDVVKS